MTKPKKPDMRGKHTGGIMVTNDHNVPIKQWRKWNETARHVFNELYGHMIDSPWIFQAPSVVKMKVATQAWQVTAWNAAFIAADAVRTHGQMERPVPHERFWKERKAA